MAAVGGVAVLGGGGWLRRRLAGWRCWVAVLVVAAVGGLAMLGGGDC